VFGSPGRKNQRAARGGRANINASAGEKCQKEPEIRKKSRRQGKIARISGHFIA
jgi:hypothetical protein